MSTPEEEMNDALDKLEAEGGEEAEVIKADDSVEEEIIEDEPKEKPPGYLSYEEWVAKGKDPADFRGENAYKKQYDALKEVRELKDTMNHVVEGVETWKQQQNDQMAQQIEQARLDAVAELARAKEEEDLDAALIAQDKINKIDSRPQPVQVNPIISDFARKNPIIDTQSTQYDADFHQDMIMIHNGKLDQLLGGDRSRAGELTPQQIERVQTMAFNQAKELHPNKFVSPRNKRTTAAQPSKRTTQTNTNVKEKLKTVEGNSRNVRDTNPANDIYEILKARDPKAAETFAKNLTGDE
jgi:hypothetical protein